MSTRVEEFAEMLRRFAERTGCDSPADLNAYTLGAIQSCVTRDDLDGVKAALAALDLVRAERSD